MWFAQVWFIAAASDGDPAFGLAEQVARAALWQGWLRSKSGASSERRSRAVQIDSGYFVVLGMTFISGGTLTQSWTSPDNGTTAAAAARALGYRCCRAALRPRPLPLDRRLQKHALRRQNLQPPLRCDHKGMNIEAGGSILGQAHHG